MADMSDEEFEFKRKEAEARARAQRPADPRPEPEAEFTPPDGPADPEALAAFNTQQREGGASGAERNIGRAISFLSGSPLFGAQAGLVGALRGEGWTKGRLERLRSADQATQQFSPKVAGVPVLPALGGVVATLPAGLASTGLARVGLTAGIGGASATGTGKAALVDGDISGTLEEAAIGTGTGAAAGLLGEGAGAALRGVTSRLGGSAAKSADAARALIDKARQSAVASERQGLSTLSAAQVRAFELARETLAAPPGMHTPAELAAAQTFVDDLTKSGNMTRVLSNAFDKGNSALAAEPAQRAVLQQVTQAASPQAVAAETAQTLQPGALLGDLVGRAWKSIGQRAAMSAGGAAIGGLFGGPIGAGGGALVGGIAPGALQMVRNVAKAPKFQYAAAKGAEAAMMPVATSAPALTRGMGAEVSRQPAAPSPRPGFMQPRPVQSPALAGATASVSRALNPDDEEAVRAFESAP